MHKVVRKVLLVTMMMAHGATAGERLCGVEPCNEVVIDFKEKKAQVKAPGAKATQGNGLAVSFPKAGSGVILSAPDGKWNLDKYVVVAVDNGIKP